MTSKNQNILLNSVNRRVFAFTSATFAATAAFGQRTNTFPTKPIRWVIPSPPGSLGDVFARLYGTGMGDALKQSIVVDNKPGAGGALAAEVVAKAPADGYTLLLATDSLLTINPFIYTTLPYDSRRDFQPISLLGKASVVMVASPALGAKSLQDLMRIAKSRPGSLNYASGGNGHTTHLAMELFMSRADIKMAHVPYKGTAPAMLGVLGNETSVTIIGIAEALPHIKSGKVIPLATSGPFGKTLFPELPELKEIHSDLDLAFWFAVLAPAKTPSAVTQTLSAAITKVSMTPEVKQKLSEFGVSAISSTPATVSDMITADLVKYGPMVRSLGIKAD